MENQGDFEVSVRMEYQGDLGVSARMENPGDFGVVVGWDRAHGIHDYVGEP